MIKIIPINKLIKELTINQNSKYTIFNYSIDLIQIFKNRKYSKHDLFDRKPRAKGLYIFLEIHTHIPHAIFELHRAPRGHILRLTNSRGGGEQ